MYERQPMARCQCGWVRDSCNICGFESEESQGQDQPADNLRIGNSRRNHDAPITKTWQFLGYAFVTLFIGLIIEAIGSTNGCREDSGICWKNGFFAFLGDGIYSISIILFVVFLFLFFSYPFRVAMSRENANKKRSSKKNNMTPNTVKYEPREKIVDGWLKICESCSSEFRVMLKENEMGLVDSMKSIKKWYA